MGSDGGKLRLWAQVLTPAPPPSFIARLDVPYRLSLHSRDASGIDSGWPYEGAPTGFGEAQTGTGTYFDSVGGRPGYSFVLSVRYVIVPLWWIALATMLPPGRGSSHG